MNPRPTLGLLQRRECLLPTRRGWLALVLVFALSGLAIVRGVHGFLAVHQPVPGGVLVVEGWIPDYAVAATLAEFRRQHYAGIFTTGTPIEHGEVLSEHKTFADLNAAVLLRLGADPQSVHAIPSPAVGQDRTYAAAVAVRDWLHAHGLPREKVNVISVGAHARRTRLLYEKAFGPSTQVGIIAIPDRDFEPARWWRSSQGFRVITGEVIAYFYARCLFHPEPQTPPLHPPQ